MKKLLIVIATIISLNLSAQDCNSPDNLAIISGNVGFVRGYMTPTIKIGIWRNVRPSGFTAFLGYQDASIVHTAIRQGKIKGDTLRFVNTCFIEAGYKFRLNEKLFLNTYLGLDNTTPYFGTDLLYQLGSTALIGLNYRKQAVGILFIVRLN